MHHAAMTINEEIRGAETPRAQTVMAVGGILGALAAASCCILPLALFSLGISGAWIGNFTQLAPAAEPACQDRARARCDSCRCRAWI
jgi:MerT mercuric transport protein